MASSKQPDVKRRASLREAMRTAGQLDGERAARIDQRDEAKTARSRSRGRTPSELLARKQQLAAETPQVATAAAALVSAESKLESLSAMLKWHQADEQQQQQQQQADSMTVASAAKSTDDLYILLAKKEKDLQLAAELGKVLLERNDELSKANESMAEQYSRKLELLEQEKHRLTRKLDLLDGEHENRLIELQTDCNILKNQLEQQQAANKQAEKEKSKLIGDLVQQNQRLMSELAEATKSEELLSSQLEQVNERLQARSSNGSDRAAQLEALQAELQVLTRRKQDLERRLKQGGQERASLLAAIEQTGDKLLVLENLLNERELRIGELALEIGELRDSSAWLSAQLESMINLNERLASSNRTTSEAPLDELRSLSDRERSHLVEQLKELRLKRSSRLKANERMLAAAAGRRSQRRVAQNRSPTSSVEDEDELLESGRTKQVIQKPSDLTPAEAFELLRELHTQLTQRKERLIQQQQQQSQRSQQSQSQSQSSSMTPSSRTAPSSSAEDSGLGADEPFGSGELKLVITDWRQLVEALCQLVEELPCASCHLMISERADYEQLQRAHGRLCDDIRLKNEELLKVQGENIEQRTKLAAAEERSQLLAQDLEAATSGKPAEEIVQLAWRARDHAVQRKNTAEIQLARTRIENMQVNSQLMEVVQQKGALSQKLAQFEDDIHYMMQRSVHARFSWEELAEQTARRQSQHRTPPPTGLQQLLSLSSAVLLSPSKRNSALFFGAESSEQSAGNNNNNNNNSLLSNLKAPRFNLKFWQRADSQEQASLAQ